MSQANMLQTNVNPFHQNPVHQHQINPNPANSLFLQVADRIGRNLCRDAVWDGARASWLGWSMELVNQNWVSAYRSFAADLYMGTSGIALFLAELQQFTGDVEQRRAVEGALNQILSLLPTFQGSVRNGFYSGVAGIAWAIVRIGTLLGHEGVIARGLEEMASLSKEAPDELLLDVIGGSAGIIPALLTLAASHERPDFVELATRHGDHLLRTAVKNDNGWSWDTMHVPGQAHLTGHSHGVAGVVTALLELFRATGESRFRDGAMEGLRYERSLFSPTHCNWPDLRQMGAVASAPIYNMAWCHGAPGIGLSRLRNVQLLPGDAEVLQELEAALKTTSASLTPPWMPGMGNYSLCHGQAGNTELLLMAGASLNRPELIQIAHKIGHEGFQHYGQPEQPWPCGVMGAGETPNLMLGTAGIGHFYLRLHDPAKVPSILIIEPNLAAA